jgi:hypothetical protein
MIRGLLLILDAGGSWTKIAQAQPGYLFIIFVHLLPLIAITLGLEGYAMTRLGEGRTITGDIIPVTQTQALAFIICSAGLNFLMILVASKLVQHVAKSFHTMLSYLACFRLLAYTLSPLFLLHLLDALPGAPTWVCYAIGILLSVGVLYLGIPILMRPDPAKAMGIYLIAAVPLIVLSGFVHFLSIQVLHNQLNLRFWHDFL